MYITTPHASFRMLFWYYGPLGPGHTGLVKSFGQVIWLPLEIYFLYEEDELGIQDSKTPFNFLIRQSDEKLRPKNRPTNGLDQMT